MPKTKLIWGVLITFAALLLSCGYRFSGSGNLPAGIQRVFIPVLENRTAETGLENTLSGDLRYEFIRNDRDATPEDAEAVLSGTIKSLQVGTISRSGTHSSLERRVTVYVDLKLTDRNGRVLWSVDGLADSETYRVGTDDREADFNKRAALSVLTKRLAETIYARMTEDF